MIDDMWNYDEYWLAVLGQRSADQTVAEFELVPGASLSEWLATAEAEAWRVGAQGGDLPAEWTGFHARALADLTEACARR